jgi:phage regulator Rha-like protein
MEAVIPKIEDLVYIEIDHSGFYTDTLIIAKATNQRHADILRKAKRLYEAQKIGERNISLATYSDKQGKPRKKYKFTKPGALALLLSFKGRKYDRLRLDIAIAFDSQEKELKLWRNSRHELKEETKDLHDILDPLHKALVKMYPDSSKGRRLFDHVHKSINRVALGKYSGTKRDMLSQADLQEVERIERHVENMAEDFSDHNPMAVRWVILEVLKGNVLDRRSA